MWQDTGTFNLYSLFKKVMFLSDQVLNFGEEDTVSIVEEEVHSLSLCFTQNAPCLEMPICVKTWGN